MARVRKISELEQAQQVIEIFRKIQHSGKLTDHILILRKALSETGLKVDWVNLQKRCRKLTDKLEVRPIDDELKLVRGLFEQSEDGSEQDPHAQSHPGTTGQPPVSWPVLIFVIVLIVSDGPSPLMDAVAASVITAVIVDGSTGGSGDSGDDGGDGEGGEGGEGGGEEN